MRVIIACEFSGVVRDAFLSRGHDAWSCDLLPCEVAGPHIQGDVLEVLDGGWDLMIAHPPCTHLTRAGDRWHAHSDARLEATKAHEYLFLLTRSARYYYDADAIRESVDEDYLRARWSGSLERTGANGMNTPQRSVGNGKAQALGVNPAGRNKRSVWEIATAPFPQSHFATFPPALVEPCIKAGTSEKGCCSECGAPWVRVVESHIEQVGKSTKGNAHVPSDHNWSDVQIAGRKHVTTTGWQPSCAHTIDPQPCTVLDPFVGAGTTLLVADRLQRHGIGIELNVEYAELARRRLTGDAPMFADVEVA